jgi:DinB superfamily
MDLEASLDDNRARVNDFIVASRGTAGSWNTPVRPGKWSPAELAEHINLSYRQSAEMMGGQGTGGFPKVPVIFRPLLRKLAFRPVLRRGRFGRPVKTFKSLTPSNLPKDPGEAAERLGATLQAYEATVRSISTPTIRHPAFGEVSATDYVLFLAIHTRHHQGQLTV